ncbi:MAG: M48 family metallopeptidase [Desulfovibrionaceae bacterium]|nr:M48 family metallopeptidase [Desulfovibrionaceae bacterium]
MQQEPCSFCHNGLTIPYIAREGAPNRTRVTVRVSRHGQVEVLYPRGDSPERAHAFIRERAAWVAAHVLAAQKRGASAPPPESPKLRYCLGRPYAVDILNAAHFHGMSVREPEGGEPGRLIISAPTGEHAEQLIRRWYEQRAREALPSSMERLMQGVPWLTKRPPLSFRHLRARLGSCSSKGSITLAYELIRLPQDCADFVILHELTHLRHMNHGPAFYAELTRLLPDWKQRKERLDAFPAPFRAEK